MSIDELVRVFKTLPAETPIPDGVSTGYGWFDASLSPVAIQNLVHALWQGKSFHNSRLLGTHTLYNIVYGQLVFPGSVHAGTSRIDGRGVLVLDWTAISPFYDQIRMIEPGVYIGNSFIEDEAMGAIVTPLLQAALSVPVIGLRETIKPNVPVLNLILNTNCPGVYWTS